MWSTRPTFSLLESSNSIFFVSPLAAAADFRLVVELAQNVLIAQVDHRLRQRSEKIAMTEANRIVSPSFNSP